MKNEICNTYNTDRIDVRTILKRIIMKEVTNVRSEFKWPRIGSNGRLLYTQHWNFGLYKNKNLLDNLKEVMIIQADLCNTKDRDEYNTAQCHAQIFSQNITRSFRPSFNPCMKILGQYLEVSCMSFLRIYPISCLYSIYHTFSINPATKLWGAELQKQSK